MRSDESNEFVRPPEWDVDSHARRAVHCCDDSVIVDSDFNTLKDTACGRLLQHRKPGPCSLCREIYTHVSHNHTLSTHLGPGASHYISPLVIVCVTHYCVMHGRR